MLTEHISVLPFDQLLNLWPHEKSVSLAVMLLQGTMEIGC